MQVVGLFVHWYSAELPQRSEFGFLAPQYKLECLTLHQTQCRDKTINQLKTHNVMDHSGTVQISACGRQ